MDVQERPLGAQISHMLKARGVRHIFGIPGVHNQELYRGIEEAGITHVLARHEQGAGFMADGYARATNGIGVCYLITGPGFVNAMTALGQAYSDHASILAIAACLDDAAGRRGQLHQMRDQEGAGRTVCAWSETARTSEAAYALIDRAMEEMLIADSRPRAVHVPIKLLQDAAAPAPSRMVLDRKPIEPDPDWIAYTATELREAKRPLFIFGGGARQLGVPDLGDDRPQRLERLLEQTGAAAFTTYAGRGIVPVDHPRHLGGGLYRPSARKLIASADLVVAVGTQLAEVDMWRDTLGHTARLIRVDIDPEVLSSTLPLQFTLRSDAERFVDRLVAELDGHQATSGWTQAEIAAHRAAVLSGVAAEFPGTLPIIDALREAMPDDAMIYSDMTQLAYAAKEIWDMPRPGHWHHPSGFGTLGYSLPAAIGGAVARPDKPTCCIIGDYGIQYTIAELGTAVELGLPLPILLWDNGKLGAIEDSMIAAQIAPNAVIQRNPDFLALARAWGAGAVEPGTLSALQAALQEAFMAQGPTVIRMTPALSA